MVQSKRYATLLIVFLLALHSQVSEAQETGSFVTINKAEIYFEEHGSGEPLLLLHGFINSGRQYSTIIPELVEKYRVIVPDFRGHGYSTNPEKIFTHKQFADDMFALLEHLGIDEYSAIGYSSGSMTLLQMATQQSDWAKMLVLILGSHYIPHEARQIQQQMNPDELPEEMLSSMAEQFGHRGGVEQTRQLFRHFTDFRHSYDDVNFTPPYLGKISAPTLIIHGDRDDFFPVEIPVEMYRSIPDSYLWIVANTGHLNVFEAPGFLRRLISFWTGIGVATHNAGIITSEARSVT